MHLLSHITDSLAIFSFRQSEYFKISVDNTTGMTVSNGIHNGSDCVSRLFLRVVFFLNNPIKQLKDILKLLPPLPPLTLTLAINDLTRRKSQTTSPHLDDLTMIISLLLITMQFHHLLQVITYTIYIWLYLSMILIATFTPVFLLMALLTMANDPL